MRRSLPRSTRRGRPSIVTSRRFVATLRKSLPGAPERGWLAGGQGDSGRTVAQNPLAGARASPPAAEGLLADPEAVHPAIPGTAGAPHPPEPSQEGGHGEQCSTRVLSKRLSQRKAPAEGNARSGCRAPRKRSGRGLVFRGKLGGSMCDAADSDAGECLRMRIYVGGGSTAPVQTRRAGKLLVQNVRGSGDSERPREAGRPEEKYRSGSVWPKRGGRGLCTLVLCLLARADRLKA